MSVSYEISNDGRVFESFDSENAPLYDDSLITYLESMAMCHAFKKKASLTKEMTALLLDFVSAHLPRTYTHKKVHHLPNSC